MTLLIRTLSHQTIEGGFYASFGDFFRFGVYSFPTPFLYRVAREFAAEPALRTSKLLTYGLEKVDRRFEEHLEAAVEKVDQKIRSGEKGGIVFVPTKVEEPRLEDEVNRHGDGKEILLRINKGCRSLAFGKYTLSGLQFGSVLYYACEGGHLGWPGGTEPLEAETTLEAIIASRHAIYRDLQRCLLKRAPRTRN
ncbi:MAG: hypothetical protein AABX13_05695 [Nanoarchaeota archaeon]